MQVSTSNLFRGGWITCTKQYFGELAIPVPDPLSAAEGFDHEAISALAKRIVAAKEADSKADTTDLELDINARVYRIYGLTPDEIKIVEESVR